MPGNKYRLMGYTKGNKESCGELIGVEENGNVDHLSVKDIAFIDGHVEDDVNAFTVYRFGEEKGSLYRCKDVDERIEVILLLTDEIFDFTNKEKSSHTA